MNELEDGDSLKSKNVVLVCRILTRSSWTNEYNDGSYIVEYNSVERRS